jgi:hypothetical protein
MLKMWRDVASHNKGEVMKSLESIIDDVYSYNLKAEQHNRMGMTYMKPKNIAEEIRKYIKDSAPEKKDDKPNLSENPRLSYLKAVGYNQCRAEFLKRLGIEEDWE